MTLSFGEQALDKLRKPFAKEWDDVRLNAQQSRASGQLSAAIRDEFDLLGVNHFHNLFDSYHSVLLPPRSPDTPDHLQKKQRSSFLHWLREIRELRDPMSHPAEDDFPREDAYSLLDCARRVLLRLDLMEDAARLKSLQERVLSRYSVSDAGDEPRSLEDRLPPMESIVIDFVGRGDELQELWDWFENPTSRSWLLAGEGGLGKSAIAYRFAQDVKRRAPAPFQVVLWLSAKRRRFIDGNTIPIKVVDFENLDSALDVLLTQYGWTEELSEPTETKRQRVCDLLRQFPALVVVDDIDSLAEDNENAVEFFRHDVSTTHSKVLFTSRRVPFGMGGMCSRVNGFDKADSAAFVHSRCKRIGLDSALFDKKLVEKTAHITGGSPLYIDDLIRLAACTSVKDAIAQWAEKGGQAAREYALSREMEMLSRPARRALQAACIWRGPVTIVELQSVAPSSIEDLESGLSELRSLFLVPMARLIDGEERFEVGLNPDYS